MRTANLVARWIMRPTGMAQVVLGVLFWIGWALALVPLHMLIGLVFVLSIWVLAALAARARVRPALVVAAVLWGALVLGFGIIHPRLLPGHLHWIVRTLHLAIGLIAMPLAWRLVVTMRARTEGPAPADGIVRELAGSHRG